MTAAEFGRGWRAVPLRYRLMQPDRVAVRGAHEDRLGGRGAAPAPDLGPRGVTRRTVDLAGPVQPDHAARGGPVTVDLDAHQRALARNLGVTATALYWHVATRDDVLDLAADHVFGDVPLRRPTRGWRADVRHLARGWRAAVLDHPWVTGLIGRPMIGPNVRARTEFLQSALIRGGLTGRRLAVTTRLVANFVIGAAATDAVGQRTKDDDDLFTRGLDIILGATRIH